MTTDAVNTAGALVYTYPELEVRLGPTSGSPPGTADTFDDVYCTRVVQSAGGSRLDFAELSYSLTDHLTNRNQPAAFARMVAIAMPDGPGTRLFLGDYVKEKNEVKTDGESLTAQGQLRAYHFGTPVKGFDVWNAIDSSVDVINDHIVFNPKVDDRTLFNMSSKTRTGGSGRLWTHAESAFTTAGETYQGQTRAEWTLRRAVEAMCELLNPNEEFIRNPTFTDLLVVNTAPDVRAVTIEIGTMLPQALDTLLIPLGYNWHVNYDTAASKPKIRVFKIGDGTGKELLLQAPGASLNLQTSNVNQYEIENNIGDSANQFRVLGEFEEVEVTIPLYPSWDEAHDTLDASDLAKDGTEYPGKETVWRLFVANEAGDIDPDSLRWGQNPTPLDLTGVVGTWLPHRRTINEPLTYMGGLDSEARRPLFIEYSDDKGVTWQPVKESWSIKLMPEQIGILFDGDQPPEEIVAADTELRIRITGTVFGDNRLEGFAARETFAVNGRVVEHCILKPDKFQKRFRCDTGKYRSTFDESGKNEASERDDTNVIQAFAEALRDQNHHAEIDCEFRLPGWHLEYEIGDLITKISGREINLDAASTTAPTARYVQIVERRFENGSGGPSTVLIVDRGIAPVIPQESAGRV